MAPSATAGNHEPRLTGRAGGLIGSPGRLLPDTTYTAMTKMVFLSHIENSRSPKMEPSPTETNGRSHDGRFGAANRFAVGNPHAVAVGRLRSALLAAVSVDDVRVVVEKLVRMAKEGDIKAAKLILDRCVGKFVDAMPSPKTSTSELPTHGADGIELTFEQKKDWLRARINRLIGDDPVTGKVAIGLGVDERRSRIAEICRTAIDRGGTGGQTEQHEADHIVASDTDNGES